MKVFNRSEIVYALIQSQSRWWIRTPHYKRLVLTMSHTAGTANDEEMKSTWCGGFLNRSFGLRSRPANDGT
jgi:hypothetical protein